MAAGYHNHRAFVVYSSKVQQCRRHPAMFSELRTHSARLNDAQRGACREFASKGSHSVEANSNNGLPRAQFVPNTARFQAGHASSILVTRSRAKLLVNFSFNVPELFERPDDKNNHAGHVLP
jgi:hypothetical protein